MLRQLKPDKFEDIIAAVALYRPGPMDLIPSYVDRRHERQVIDYPHPLLEKILKETYGIIVYQEQVMQIARRWQAIPWARPTSCGGPWARRSGKKWPSSAKSLPKALSSAEWTGQGGRDLRSHGEIAVYGFNKSHCSMRMHWWPTRPPTSRPTLQGVHGANLTLDLSNTDKVSQHIAECMGRGLQCCRPTSTRAA